MHEIGAIAVCICCESNVIEHLCIAMWTISRMCFDPKDLHELRTIVVVLVGLTLLLHECSIIFKLIQCCSMSLSTTLLPEPEESRNV